MPAKTWRQHRSRVALLAKEGADPELIDEARRDMRVAQLGDQISRVRDLVPAPTAEQIRALRNLLPPVSDEAAIPA